MSHPAHINAPMRFAYADPPYLGCGHLYDAHHAESRVWDDQEAHRRLVAQMCDEYPDGWALSLHEPSLRTILNFCPEDVRVASWVKPFASFKPNVTRAYTWEPVIFRGGRPIPKTKPTWRDHLAESITLRKGLTGAKPWRFCEWVLDGLGYEIGDSLDDLFPGTGIMAQVIDARKGAPIQEGLFAQ